ncbi:hypothetical protein JCM10450v2_001013 [Rhodotorula kratochvilovae]
MGKDLERFTTPLPDYLHCAVCLEAAYPPVPYCTSEHMICMACLWGLWDPAEHSDQPRPPCPTCRRPSRDTFCIYVVSPGLQRAIESYGYKCNKRGCTWVGSVGDEAAHDKTCIGRLESCGYCGERQQKNEMAAHHNVCPECPVNCPRGGRDCGGKRFGGRMGRGDMKEKHRNECTMYRCRVTPGCPTRTTRANRNDHEVACKSVQEALEKAQNEIVELRRELRDNKQQAPVAKKAVEQGPLIKGKGKGKELVRRDSLEAEKRDGGDDDSEELVILGAPANAAKRIRSASPVLDGAPVRHSSRIAARQAPAKKQKQD